MSKMEHIAQFIASEPDPIKRIQMKAELNKTIEKLEEMVKK